MFYHSRFVYLLSVWFKQLSDLTLPRCSFIKGLCVFAICSVLAIVGPESGRMFLLCRLVCVCYLFDVSDCLIRVCLDVLSLLVCVCLLSVRCDWLSHLSLLGCSLIKGWCVCYLFCVRDCLIWVCAVVLSWSVCVYLPSVWCERLSYRSLFGCFSIVGWCGFAICSV